MAWGVWNKIKKGFQKVGRGIKKGINWIGEKVMPHVKPVYNAVKPYLGGVGDNKYVNAIVDRSDDIGNFMTGKKKLDAASARDFINSMK